MTKRLGKFIKQIGTDRFYVRVPDQRELFVRIISVNVGTGPRRVKKVLPQKFSDMEDADRFLNYYVPVSVTT